MMINLEKLNFELKEKSPIEIVKWAIDFSRSEINKHKTLNPVICSTNFRPYESVILDIVTKVDSKMPILWADSGLFLPETYNFAEKLKNLLNLNLKIYNPQLTEARRKALFGDIPGLSEPEKLVEFTQQVKIEPFKRGLKELSPIVWISAIRKEQSDFRANLDIVTLGLDGIYKVSPLFYWTESDMKQYLLENNLPNETVYFDYTKIDEKRECGLHPQTS